MLQTCPLSTIGRTSRRCRSAGGVRRKKRPRSQSASAWPPTFESLKASGPGYNTRVEEALRKAGFGATKKKPATKKAATKRARAAKKRA